MQNVKVAHGKASRGTPHTAESPLQQKTSSACTLNGYGLLWLYNL